MTRYRQLGMVTLILAMAGCGGGDDAQTPVYQVNDNVISNATTGATVVNSISSVDQGGSVILSKEAAYKTGDTVSFAPDSTKGMRFGYTGVVTSTEKVNEGTKVNLRPATVKEAFKSLNYDFNSTRDGVRIIDVITPQSMSIGSVASRYDRSRKRALAIAPERSWECESDTDSQGRVCLGGAGAVNISKDGDVKLQLGFKLEELEVEKEVQYDSILTGEGSTSDGQAVIKTVRSRVKGKWEVSAKIIAEKETAISGSLADLLDTQKQWDELQARAGFLGLKVTGLNGDDKKGMLPVAGIVMTPLTKKGFVGDLDVDPYKNGAIIVWLYIQLDASAKVSGELTFLSASGSFDRALSLSDDGAGEMEGSEDNSPQPPAIISSGINGKLEGKHTIGLVAAADLLVGGIRPVAAQWLLSGFEVSGALLGEYQHSWLPKATDSGYICWKADVQFKSAVNFRAALGVRIKKWVDLGGEYSYTKDFPFLGGELIKPGCIALPAPVLTAKVVGLDLRIPGNSIIEVDFSQTGTILLSDLGSIDLERGGAFPVSLLLTATERPYVYTASVPSGENSILTLTLYSEKFGSMGSSAPLTVAVAPVQSLSLNAFTYDFNCSKIWVQLSSRGLEGFQFKYSLWALVGDDNVTPLEIFDGGPDAYAALALPSCAPVRIVAAAEDASGKRAVSQIDIDPGQLAAPSFDYRWTTNSGGGAGRNPPDVTVEDFLAGRRIEIAGYSFLAKLQDGLFQLSDFRNPQGGTSGRLQFQELSVRIGPGNNRGQIVPVPGRSNEDCGQMGDVYEFDRNSYNWCVTHLRPGPVQYSPSGTLVDLNGLSFELGTKINIHFVFSRTPQEV